MARKVIIDCDPGIDDAVALCMALFDPRLEVVAVTATAGNVSAEQASCNVQAIIERLDPPRFPRVGVATPAEDSPGIDGRSIHGDDGLGNCGFPSSQLHHQHPAEKIICDEVRAAPDQITIICLGPLTNIARAFQRDPGLATVIGRLIIMGGSVLAGGNVTAAAEFNMYYDPLSAYKVFRSPTTKTLIPLDVTRQLTFPMSFLNDLPEETTRAGAFLRKILPHLYRSYHQKLGIESVLLHDVVALLAALQPELFHTTEMAGDIETDGRLTAGATIFDRRPMTQMQANMEVATEVDTVAAMDSVIRALQHAGRGG
jgi:inosine-uridine nucleoside N-ribohydrolase